MEEVRIVTTVIYETGPYSDVWPFIEVGFGDPRFKEPVSFRFLDEDDLPEGRGGTDYSLIPIEIRDQVLRMASKPPPLLSEEDRVTEEDRGVGGKYFLVLTVLAKEEPLTYQRLRVLLQEQGVSYSVRTLRRIVSKLQESALVYRKREGGGSQLNLTKKGLILLKEMEE